MFAKLLLGLVLMAATVAVHATGITAMLRAPRLRLDRQRHHFVFWTWLFIRLAALIILCHVIEITVWAWGFWVTHAMPDAASALYFSAVTYTTTGYGDLVLPLEWRVVGGIEALTGILMCGWSSGFFFGIVSQMGNRSSSRTAETVR